MKDHRLDQPSRTPTFMRTCVGLLSLPVSGLCLAVLVGAADAQTANPVPKGGSVPLASPATDDNRSAEMRASAPPQGDDTMMRNAAARTRMLECGHQWSAKKKAGTAVGTWKDFFKTCLTRQ